MSKSPSLEKVSPRIAADLLYNIITHDDGVEATGGESCLITGSMGSGKTTLEIQLAAATRHVEGSIDKHKAKKSGGPYQPETVIWRGRKYDYWTVFLEDNWKKAFPGVPHKPLRILVDKRSDLKFFTHQYKRDYLDLEDYIRFYGSVDDAWRQLIPGGINVIYEPVEYMLPPHIVHNLLKAQLKDIFPLDECPYKPASSFIWWFEFCGHMMITKRRRDYITLIMDEAHEVFHANRKGDHWHLIGAFSDQVIDFRRNNISFIPVTQEGSLLDWRIVNRMTHFIWLRGSRPIERRSRVSRKLVGCLSGGQAIIERSMERFGLAKFGRIPNQPPVIQVEGLPEVPIC
jgi:energy-coupling factor transporter ATP-binding protein EcfA2